jgi:hypothetical protein
MPDLPPKLFFSDEFAGITVMQFGTSLYQRDYLRPDADPVTINAWAPHSAGAQL